VTRCESGISSQISRKSLRIILSELKKGASKYIRRDIISLSTRKIIKRMSR
jgi:hypothetical protein